MKIDNARNSDSIKQEFLQSKKESIKQELIKAQANTLSAEQFGIKTANLLVEQEEKLNSIEDNLDSQEKDVDRSLYLLRGMTWSGAIYNGFSVLVDSVKNTSSTIVHNAFNNQATEEQSVSRVDQSNEGNKDELFGSTKNYAQSENNEEEQMLANISSHLENIKQLGLNINENLCSQSEKIESITDQSDRIQDKTLQATFKATKLSNKYSSSSSNNNLTYVGSFLLMTPEGLLAVPEKSESSFYTYLSIEDSVSAKTVFRIFTKNHNHSNIYGIQSANNNKFIGLNIFGHIIIDSDICGSQEELFIDYTGKNTGLLFYAKNWGSGAWLKTPTKHTTLITETEQSRTSYEFTTTRDISDKQEMLTIVATKVDERKIML